MPRRPLQVDTRGDDRPTLYDRSRACREVLRHGEPIPVVAARYNVPVQTLKAWLRAAKARAKLKYTRDYPTVPYSY
jgi:transposase-like protein